MLINYLENKWLKKSVKALSNIAEEADSSAARNSPMSDIDLKKLKDLCYEGIKLINKYSKKR